MTVCSRKYDAQHAVDDMLLHPVTPDVDFPAYPPELGTLLGEPLRSAQNRGAVVVA